MKAIILAAGQSSRIYPFAQNTHKSMIKIMGKPILEYTIDALRKGGIKDLVLVISRNSQIQSYFVDGKIKGVNIKYIIQNEPLGMGNALLLAKKEIDEDFLLLNAHHLDVSSFLTDLIKTKIHASAVLVAREKNFLVGQGILKVIGERVLEIIEKPPKGSEPSNLCVVGVYLLPKDFIKTLASTSDEQYQLEKALTAFAKENLVKFIKIKEETISLKYPWDLLSFKNYLLRKIKRNIDKTAKIAKSAEIVGEVIIDQNAVIMEGVRIKGPCYIGKNVVVGNNSLLRDGVIIEDNSSVGAFAEIKNTLIMESSKAHSGFIGDTVIGMNTRIGAQFCAGNVRLDRENIAVEIKNERVDSGLKYLGVFIGNDVRIGIKCATMPGVIIGNNSVIGPSTTVFRNVLDSTKYYTKFLEIVTKNKK